MFKEYISPILRVCKSTLLVFLPFYWLRNMSSKFEQLNPSHGKDSRKDRKPDDYNSHDVDNSARANIRFFAMMLGMTFMGFGLTALLTNLVGVLGIFLGIIIGVGIMPGLCDLIAKQTLRFMSWMKHKDDPLVINKTYPKKYMPNTGLFSRGYTRDWSSDDPVLDKMKQEDFDKGYRAIKALYEKKRDIKSHPEGWFGLSDKQKETCATINCAVTFFRNEPYAISSHINGQYHRCTFFNQTLKGSLDTPEKQQLIHDITNT
jgi:hypothetical protein